MSLKKYVQKRDFEKTTEPQSGKSKDKDKLSFVIQKHDASHLHYDFRLEMEGVLKSWAIPKGPSTDPKTKRLAMMVEDHPYDYRSFEGIIPKGEYGGGTVIIWDKGTYEPIEEIKGKKAQEKHLLGELHAGSLKIKLHGEKLQGEFALVKTHGMGENSWLLIKHKDEYASVKEVVKLDKSVVSGKTIEQLAKEQPEKEQLEKDTEIPDTAKTKSNTSSIRSKPKPNSTKSAPAGLLNPEEETQVHKINGHELRFTHLSKFYWPEDQVTKRELFNYYDQVAAYILPYIKDRPMSLNRFPGGIHTKGFYQKDVKGKAPEWAKTFPHTTADGKKREYLVGTDEASLLWMVSLGCIEINPWFSRIQSEDYPDYCVIDLDPDQSNTFDQVVEVALQVKQVLDAINAPGYVKTSGATGMHIYIPLAAKYTYDQSQLFAKTVVNLVQKQLPELTTVERMTDDRNGKMYLDFLQNRPEATIACPYSLRPEIGATVSMPLHWDEVKPGLKINDFTIFNAIERLKTEGDLFKGILGKGVDLEKAIKKAKSIFD